MALREAQMAAATGRPKEGATATAESVGSEAHPQDARAMAAARVASMAMPTAVARVSSKAAEMGAPTAVALVLAPAELEGT